MATSKITVIPARKNTGNTIKKAEKPKLRVAAYCRVSTDSEDQASSYETQISHYTEYILKNPDWQLAGIFADEGITGTNTKKRTEFNRMIDECMEGNIDMIITKSVSRFARNTVDCLKYIRQLKEKNIPVFFEKESINTMDSKGEVLLTIMASLAQQESQSMSQNVKLGFQYRFQQGKVIVNHKHFLGYTKDANGNLIIDPAQAEVVKRIFREYLEGYSTIKIAAGLEADGILTGAGRKKWHGNVITKILQNEKYMGDALLQKTYTTDFLTKTRVENNGIMPQYYIEDNHEAIIPKHIFLMAQEEMARRRKVHTSPTGERRVFSSNHCFTNIIFCHECNDVFRRIHWNNNGCKSIVWCCANRLSKKGTNCKARTVKEEHLMEIVLKAINLMLIDKEKYVSTLKQNITTAIMEIADATISEINQQLQELQRELVRRAKNKEDYDDIAKEILSLKSLKSATETGNLKKDEQLNRINELCQYIENQPSEITVFDEKLVRRVIKSITVFDDHFTVTFKSGLSVDIPE